MESTSSPFFVRMARPSDIAECRAVDVEAWGEESAATVEMLASRVAIFPFGNYVAIEPGTEKILGTVWSVATDERPFSSWWDTSGEGSYASICNPYSDTQFGINLSVPPSISRRGVGLALVRRVIETTWIAGRRLGLMGARIPYFHLWNGTFVADDYVALRYDDAATYFRDARTGLWHAGPAVPALEAARGSGLIDPREWPTVASAPGRTKVLDAELDFFMGAKVSPGGECQVFRTMPGYFPDPESCDYGVLIGWENGDHPAMKAARR